LGQGRKAIVDCVSLSPQASRCRDVSMMPRMKKSWIKPGELLIITCILEKVKRKKIRPPYMLDRE
jgi:hypothetical protein